MNEQVMDLDKKLNTYFAGRVVRKDLTKLIKEGANVPVYVLEYLLGMYCATDDEKSIEEGVERVKKILAENFVRPDEAEKVKSKIKESGQYSIIDRGKGITIEFKECKEACPKSAFETVCSFLNRNGGNLLLGVNDDGILVAIIRLIYLRRI